MLATPTQPPAAPAPPAPPGGPAPADAAINHRALLAVLLGVALATLDTAIANTALPVIAADLQASPAASIWVINAYQLAVVATLLPFAALGDVLGPRRVFLGGLAFFTVASLGCALAPSLLLLAGARALQGIGAGALMSVNLALIRAIFPASQLGRGVGLNALVVGVAFAVGPTVASLVLALGNWHWLFAINVPLGGLALAFAWPALPPAARRGHGFDPRTAALTMLGFGALIGTLAGAAQGEPWPLLLAGAVTVLACTAVLLRREAGHPAPMLPADLLRRPLFALSAITSWAAFSAQGLAFVALPFFFASVLQRNPVDTGYLMTPWPIVVALAAPIAGRLSDHYPAGLLGGVGLAVLCAGLASLALLPADASTPDIVWRMALCGAGFGGFQSPNLRALMSSAPPERSGGASGVIAVARLTGQATGAALVALSFGLAGSHSGPTWALLLGAVFAAAASAASFARLRVA